MNECGKKHDMNAAARPNLAAIGLAPAVGTYIVLAVLTIYWGRFSCDEAFYVLAAANVYEGKVPYRDFLFTQMPLAPYVYGLSALAVGKGFVAARWVSFLLGAAAVAATAVYCRRRAGRHAAAIAVLLLAVNLSFIFDTCSVKTQALTVFFLSCGLLLGELSHRASGRYASLLVMNLAVLTRLSMLPVVLLQWLRLIITYRGDFRRVVIPILVNVLIGASIVLLLYADGNLFFNIYHFHSEYFNDPSWSFSNFRSFVKGVVSNQIPILLCFIAAALIAIHQRVSSPNTSRGDRSEFANLVFLAACYLSTSFIHATRPISFPIYQTSNIIFPVAFAALVIGRRLESLSTAAKRLFYGTLVGGLFLAAPLQEFALNFRGDGGLQRVDEAIVYLRSLDVANRNILTFNIELAVDNEFSILDNYEMSSFSYFPAMADARAERLNVVNYRQLAGDILSRRASILCFTPYFFNVMGRAHREVLSGMINEQYELVKTIPQYGQFYENLYIYTLRAQ